MPKSFTIKGTTQQDLSALDRMIQELYDLVEATYKPHVPADAPKEPSEGMLYYDKTAKKLMLYTGTDTPETITSA